MNHVWPILVAVTPLLVSCLAGPLPATATSSWTAATFGGAGFQTGQLPGKTAVYRQTNCLPLIRSEQPSPADCTAITPGRGAVAGVCYRQISGGKLAAAPGVNTLAGEIVTVSGPTTTTAVTDSSGHFVLALPVGQYELSCRGAVHKVGVTAGETSLVPLRAGKRMID